MVRFFFFSFLCLGLFLGLSHQLVFAATDPIPLYNPLSGKSDADPREKINPDTVNTDTISLFETRAAELLRTMFAIFSVLALLPIVTGGIMMITSQGNSEKVEKGKASLFWGVVGLILAFSGILVFTVLLRLFTVTS